ncbi:MAG TPA: hypothetical protein DD381_14675 [Lentisphaeria bacterium]|nr:MAG: hypothetical protein A2X47_01485 [Lentisphaerae bacterium GWF2_38_69]HBM17569.1 hypothetical protein [Lentisphaeria bacterium]
MRKPSNKNKTAKLIALAGVSSLVLLLNACSSTPVLQDNGEIPPPSLNPPADANQTASPSTIIETTPAPVEKLQTSAPLTHVSSVSQVKYIVKKGDSLWKISKMFDLSVNELAAYNNIEPKASLKAGQNLQIPPAGLTQPKNISSASGSAAAVHSEGSVYVVKSGDSLWSVAKKNHISVKKLAEVNNLTSNAFLKVGQKITIPGGKATAKKAEPAVAAQEKKIVKTESSPAIAPEVATPVQKTESNNDSAKSSSSVPEVVQAAPAPEPSQEKESETSSTLSQANYLPHTVKEGDTWQTISDMYGVSIEDLKKVNPTIAGDAQPKVGIVVNIPEE